MPQDVEVVLHFISDNYKDNCRSHQLNDVQSSQFKIQFGCVLAQKYINLLFEFVLKRRYFEKRFYFYSLFRYEFISLGITSKMYFKKKFSFSFL